jgi:hypothetical protein
MKKFSLTLTAFGFCLAFISAVQADTTPASQMPSSPASQTPSSPSAATPPGTTRYVRPSVQTSVAIPDDPAVRKNDADFRAAVEKCNAIVDKDSKTKCTSEAETSYSNGKP